MSDENNKNLKLVNFQSFEYNKQQHTITTLKFLNIDDIEKLNYNILYSIYQYFTTIITILHGYKKRLRISLFLQF